MSKNSLKNKQEATQKFIDKIWEKELAVYEMAKKKFSDVKANKPLRLNYKQIAEIFEETYSSKTKIKNKQIIIWRHSVSFRRVSTHYFTGFYLKSEEEFKSNVQKYIEEELHKRNAQITRNRNKRLKESEFIPYIKNHQYTEESNKGFTKLGLYGVYAFVCDKTKYGKKIKKAYIGSTITSFQDRFKQHKDNNSDAYKLLLDGAYIEFLYIANENDTEDFIRLKESEFYSIYEDNGFELINKEFPVYHSSLKYKKTAGSNKNKNKTNKNKLHTPEQKALAVFKNIRIKAVGSDTFRIISLLEELGFKYKEDKKYWIREDQYETFLNKFIDKEKNDEEV